MASLAAGRRVDARESAATVSRSVTRARRRQLLLAVPVGLVVAAVAVPLGERLPGNERRDRFELREVVEEPPAPAQIGNPLSEVTALQASDDPEVLFRAASSAPVERYRLAVLDQYDGTEWASTTEFLPAGTELPASDGGPPPEGDEVVQDIDLGELASQYLPAADRPVRISVEGQRFDPATGVLLAGEDAPGGYVVSSVLPVVDDATLVGLEAAADAEAQAALRLPNGLPQDLQTLAEETAGSGGSGYVRAAALERFLADPADDAFTLVTDEPPSGHSFGHLTCFLLIEERCSKAGSTEQFVAAFAVMARAVGLPARIAVGFAPPAGATPTDEVDVVAADATAWAEVKLAGAGWVAFDPVPDPGVELAPPPEDVAGNDPTDDTQPPPAETDEDESADDDAVEEDEATSAADVITDPRVIALAVVALVMVALALPGILRWRRRERRRRAATPTARVTGAWDEALDELVAAGARPTPDQPSRGRCVGSGTRR